MTMRKITGIVVVTSAIMLPQLVQAGNSDIYGRIGTGVIIPTDMDYSAAASDTFRGTTASAAISGSVEFDRGLDIAGAIGYHVNDYVAIEGELGYQGFDFNKASYDAGLTFTSGGSSLVLAAAGSVDIDGGVSSWNGMGNVIITPVGRKGDFVPYVGGGLGFTRYNVEVNSLSQAGTTLTVNYDNTSTDLYTNALAGLDYKANEQTTVGAKYRYYWANTGDAVFDDFTAHSITANVMYNFN